MDDGIDRVFFTTSARCRHGSDRQIVIDAIVEIAPDADPSTVAPDEDLWYALELDSMDQLRVMTAIGERLGIDIPEADYGRMATLEAAADYLAERAAG